MKKLLFIFAFLSLQFGSYAQKYANNLVCDLVQLQNDTVDVALDTTSGFYYPKLRFKYLDSTLVYPSYNYTIVDTSIISLSNSFLQTYISFCDELFLNPTASSCEYFNAYLSGNLPVMKYKKNVLATTFVKGTFTLSNKFDNKCEFEIIYRILPARIVASDQDCNVNLTHIGYYDGFLSFGTSGMAVSIFNNEGMLVVSEEKVPNSLNVYSLKSGIYFLKTSNGAQFKFVKE